MKPEKLSTLKKELGEKKPVELVEICLRVAKLKTENKEMLSYLLFYADDPIQYAEAIKKEMDGHFATLSDHYYHSTKSLRKILRIISKYSRFTASKEGETELLLHFVTRYLGHVDLKTRHKPLQALLLRALDKITKLVPKLHEDLQYDYSAEYNRHVQYLKSRISFWDKFTLGVKEMDI